MQETNINKHLHHKEPLVPYSEMTGLVVCTTQSRYVAIWGAYFEHLYIDYQLANISSIDTGMVKARGFASFFKQTYLCIILYIYIIIYIYI